MQTKVSHGERKEMNVTFFKKFMLGDGQERT
jgi:hypothetical protein